MEKKKRGRPTIPSNFLLGNRNAWLNLLEGCWPEIGWSLICIREQRTVTIEEVQKAFEPLVGKPNWGLAAAFCHDSLEPCTTRDIRANSKVLSKLHPLVLTTEAEYATQDRLCRDVDIALGQSGDLLLTDQNESNAVQVEVTRRKESLENISKRLMKLKHDRDVLDKKVLNEKSYLYCSELLDFLQSEGRYAVKPLPLANALAGLPHMRWRQSYARCSKMANDSEPHLWYRTFVIIRRIWKRRDIDMSEAPVEYFRNSLTKLPKKSGYLRQFLWGNWRDIRLAIEECWKLENPPAGSVPFIITAQFAKNTSRQKTTIEKLLTDQEKLIPSSR